MMITVERGTQGEEELAHSDKNLPYYHQESTLFIHV